MRVLIFIAWICIIIHPTFAQKVIHINNSIEFGEEFTKEQTIYDSVNLYISSIKFYKNSEEKLKYQFTNWKNLASVKSLIFQNIPEIRAEMLSWFFTTISKNNLVSLRIKNVDVSGDLQFPPNIIFSDLKKLSIIETELDEDFFIYFNKTNFPHLTHLELIKCDLDEDYVPLLRDSGIIDQLEYLDLSKNEISNSVFNIFPHQKEGNLKILKLNQCEIILDQGNKYDSDFLALNKYLTQTQFYVEWNNLFFNKLEHLELQHSITNNNNIRACLADSAFQNLNIFIGFLPKKKEGNTTTTKQKNFRLVRNFVQIISSYPIKSVRNNYPIESPAILNLFLKSGQSKIIENINLNSDKWNYVAVRELLLSQNLPSLKEISILDTPISQNELNKLMNEFPDINFNAVLRNPGVFWPGISK